MRTDLFRTLVAISLLFTSTCRKQSTQPSSEKLHPDSPLSVPDAMRMLYGNYDAQTRSSTTAVGGTNNSKSDNAGMQQLIVRPVFHADINEAGANKFAVLTYAVPRTGFGCHACAPTIGMAVFSNTAQNWSIEASNKAVTKAGGWGQPPTDIQLVEIGTNRHAVQIRDVGEGQGETTTVLLLIPWKGTVNLGLERIIADDDKGGCGAGGLPCYSNHRTVTFLRNADAEYYDLELKLTGTDLPASESAPMRRARKVSGLEILRFENGKYVQISRQGDLTTVDRVVAGREGLK